MVCENRLVRIRLPRRSERRRVRFACRAVASRLALDLRERLVGVGGCLKTESAGRISPPDAGFSGGQSCLRRYFRPTVNVMKVPSFRAIWNVSVSPAVRLVVARLNCQWSPL